MTWANVLLLAAQIFNRPIILVPFHPEDAHNPGGTIEFHPREPSPYVTVQATTAPPTLATGQPRPRQGPRGPPTLSRDPLSSGTMTSTEAESALVLNSFYIEKVVKLREKLEVYCHPQNSPSLPRSAPNCQNKYFEFKFANESRIRKTICRLKPTRARGVDKIPASVLKLGVSVLAAPIARLVNVSLASGVVLVRSRQP
jgi:hypothetical protein